MFLLRDTDISLSKLFGFPSPKNKINKLQKSIFVCFFEQTIDTHYSPIWDELSLVSNNKAAPFLFRL